MKRALLLILAFVMVMSTFAACGDEDAKSENEATEAPAEPAVGADSPEDAFAQLVKFYTEHDPEVYAQISYDMHFNKEKTFEEYKKEFLEKYEKNHHFDENEETREYKLISVEKWDEDIMAKPIEQLSYLNNDTDKITGFADIKYTVKFYGEESEGTSTAIECDGRWYIIGE